MASTADLVNDSIPNLTEDHAASKTEEKPFKSMDFKEKLQYAKEVITIEPLLCFYVLASIVCGPAIWTLRFEMSCRNNAKFNQTICKSIVDGTHVEKGFQTQNGMVQDYINNMDAWCVPFQYAVPAILLLFLGAYSDRHKVRKPFFLIPIFGEFFACVACILCVVFIDRWPVEVEGIAQTVVPSFFGGPPILSMAAFAYLSDVSTEEMRAVRIAVMQIFLNIWSPLGFVASAFLWPVLGYTYSFVLAFIFFLLAFLYGIFMVKEPRKSSKEGTMKDLIKDAFNPQHVIETFKLPLLSRGTQRVNIMFIVVVFFILSVVLGGQGNIFLYFVQQQYGWQTTEVTYYTAAASIVNCIGLAVGVPLLSKILNLHDLIIILIFCFDQILSNIIVIAVRNSCGVYMGLVAGILLSVGMVALRSLSTKYVPEEDIAKTMSLLSVIEIIGGIIGLQVYNQGIYSHTRESFIYAFLCFSILMMFLTMPIIIWKYTKERKESPSKEERNADKSEMEMRAK